jgi:hypothetical protein
VAYRDSVEVAVSPGAQVGDGDGRLASPAVSDTGPEPVNESAPSPADAAPAGAGPSLSTFPAGKTGAPQPAGAFSGSGRRKLGQHQQLGRGAHGAATHDAKRKRDQAGCAGDRESVEDFLARGGTITRIEPPQLVDPGGVPAIPRTMAGGRVR